MCLPLSGCSFPLSGINKFFCFTPLPFTNQFQSASVFSALSLLPKLCVSEAALQMSILFGPLPWDHALVSLVLLLFVCFIVSDLRWTSSSEGNSDQLRALLAAPVSSLLSGVSLPAFVCRRALWRSRGRVRALQAGWRSPLPLAASLKALRGVV